MNPSASKHVYYLRKSKQLLKLKRLGSMEYVSLSSEQDRQLFGTRLRSFWERSVPLTNAMIQSQVQFDVAKLPLIFSAGNQDMCQ